MSSVDITPLHRANAQSPSEATRLGIRVLTSSDASKIDSTYDLGQRLGIGRSAGAEVQLVIDDRMLSRTHLSFLANGPQPTLVDHDSTNGTFHEGARITDAVLQRGDLVRAGDTLLYYGSLPRQVDDPGELIGSSLAMVTLRAELARVGGTALPVLLLGETGTGKELAARAIHRASGRKGRLVAVNCGAIPGTLAEAAFFGHKRGAFTGAERDSDGYWQSADGGTLFLDEIGELPLALQASLLRVLDTGLVTPIGSTHGQTTDVRIVSATNVNLEDKVAAGTFRHDLLARLQGASVSTVPLRARREDVLQLFRQFYNGPAKVPVEAAELLVRYPWPANMRELINTAKRLSLVSAETLTLDHLAAEGVLVSRQVGPEMTSEQLKMALVKYAGNVVAVAEHFGKDRKQIYRWLEKYQLKPTEFRKP